MDEDDFDFQEEYGAFQRQGYLERDVLAEVGINVDKRSGKDIRDPTHRFYVYVESVAKYIASNEIAGVVYRDVQTILKYIAIVPSARFKNPTAFVLGFGLTKSHDGRGRGGRDGGGDDEDIDTHKLTRLKPDLTKYELAVRIEDVIRYARMWIRLRDIGV